MIRKLTALVLGCTGILYASPYLSSYGGVSWPKTQSTLVPKEKILGNVSIEGGHIGDGVIGMGGVFEFSFSNTREETLRLADADDAGIIFTRTILKSGVKRRLLSAGAALTVTPFKNWIVRPSLRGVFLPSMMIFINDKDTARDESVIPPTGAYWGLTGFAGGDVHFMISENASLFIGSGWRFGRVRNRIHYQFDQSPSEREYVYQPLDGMVVRAGFTLWNTDK